MREHIRIEHQQCQSKQCRSHSKHLPRREKHQNRQQHREQRSRHARPEKNLLRIIPENKILSPKKRLMFEFAALESWHLELQRQQRDRRQLLDQRRVLGIQAKVAARQRHESRINVVVLVPCNGGAPCDHAQFHEEQAQENDDAHCDLAA